MNPHGFHGRWGMLGLGVGATLEHPSSLED
jgi:hypothetical protein